MMAIPTRWWQKEVEKTRCVLCFHHCLLALGERGHCGVRVATESGIASPILGQFSSCAVDPIEKKPLYHWRPGSSILSLGSIGCNMRCPFCQNHLIAQPDPAGNVPLVEITPHALVQKAKQLKLNAVAYTYNEPTLQAEYILEAAKHLKEEEIATVLVSNGMFSPQSLSDLIPYIDAANIDVKTFNPTTYAALGGSLATVKTNVAQLLDAGVHVELTTLVVPRISDSIKEFEGLIGWIADLSPGIPLHISRYFPAYHHTAPPTDIALMKEFRSIARQKLRHVHVGNVPPGLL